MTFGTRGVQYVSKDLDPHWKEIRLDLIELCNGDLNRPFLIECWDYVWSFPTPHPSSSLSFVPLCPSVHQSPPSPLLSLSLPPLFFSPRSALGFNF